MSTRETLSTDPKALDAGDAPSGALHRDHARYSDAIGVKLLRGRDFTQAECESKETRRIAIIDEEMAKKLFRTRTRLDSTFATSFRPATARLTTWRSSVSSIPIAMMCRTTPRFARLFVPLRHGYNGNIFFTLVSTPRIDMQLRE